MKPLKKGIKTNHRILDEAGDTAFYGKGKKAIIGNEGVSNCFMIGMVKFKEPLQGVRDRVQNLMVADEDKKNKSTIALIPLLQRETV